MKHINSYFLFFFLSTIVSSTIFSQTAQEIIDAAIKVHGGESYLDGRFGYDFRDKHYILTYDHGKYEYVREFTDKDGSNIRDVLTNEGFTRFQSGDKIKLDEKKANAYANSVNSVHYFAYLPFYLNDPAVLKKRLDDIEVDGDLYHQIQVTFNKEGGGADFDDVYVYWVHSERYTMDYLAYSYHVDEGGVRFRKAYNAREVGGVRWQDYINYKHEKDTPPVRMMQLYLNDELIELSRIELKNITSL